MKKELSFQEWKEIGNKAKEVRTNLSDLFSLLSRKLPKTKFLTKWFAASKAFDKLNSHLDDMVCSKFTKMPDREVTHIFYGSNEKK